MGVVHLGSEPFGAAGAQFESSTIGDVADHDHHLPIASVDVATADFTGAPLAVRASDADVDQPPEPTVVTGHRHERVDRDRVIVRVQEIEHGSTEPGLGVETAEVDGGFVRPQDRAREVDEDRRVRQENQ